MLRLITPTTLQSRLSLSRSEIQELIQRNEIPFLRLPNGGIRFDASSVDAWVQSLASAATATDAIPAGPVINEIRQRKPLSMLRIAGHDSTETHC